MTFDRMVHNDKMKAKFNSQKNWLTLKVTGEGHRGQITIENDDFYAVSSITQKLLTDLYELWQDGVE